MNVCKWITLSVAVFFYSTAWAISDQEAEVFQLGEIIVSANKEVEDGKTAITVVTEADIKASGAQSVADALTLLPGVFVSKTGKNESHVNIRGFDQRQVKVLIDGVPALETYFSTVDLSMLSVDAVAKITVTKGVSSVLYGANTIGGVVNIVTKKGYAEPGGLVTLSLGENATSHLTANYGSSIGSFNYWISGGRHVSDGYNVSGSFDPNNDVTGLGTQYNEDGGVRDLSYFDKSNLNIKFGYEPDEKTKIYLSFDYVDGERGVPTFYYRYWAFSKWDQYQINLTAEREFNEILKLKGRLFYVKHDDMVEDISWDLDHSTSTGTKKWFEKSYYDDNSIGFELQGSINLGSWSDISIGVSVIDDVHKQADFLDADCFGVIMYGDSVGWTEEERFATRTTTIAIEDEFQPADALSLTAGASLDSYGPTGTYAGETDTVNPQIGVVVDLSDQSLLRLSLGQKTRFPTMKELYSELGGGNENLREEKSVIFELGAEHAFSSDTSLNAALFHHNVTDLIASVNKHYINLNEATISGLELEYSSRVSNWLKFEANYTYLKTVDKSNDDRSLAGRPEQRINVTTRYDITEGLYLNAQAIICQTQYWENDDGVWEQLPDYMLIYARLTQEINNVLPNPAEAYLGIKNLLDADYYETNGPEPGRSLELGITARF